MQNQLPSLSLLAKSLDRPPDAWVALPIADAVHVPWVAAPTARAGPGPTQAPAPVGGARDRRGARGGGPAGWVLVGRPSAVRAPKVYKTLRLTSFGEKKTTYCQNMFRIIGFGYANYYATKN